MALPYQDLPIMDACLETGVHYMDTANYEPRDVAKFEYSWQWKYQDRYKAKGIMAILGCGFDPGQSNIYCAYAQEFLFDEIETIDIIDCNDGSHGKAFATNFNPEINLREVTQRGKYWKDGKWIDIDPLSISAMIDYPEVGPRKSYLIYHEEEESLVENIKGLKQIRFWMTFSDNYIKHLEVLQNVGMTRIDPVMYKGNPVIPMEFLKELLPPPSSLGENYTGRTSIGCIFNGKKDGKDKRALIYNVCDHAAVLQGDRRAGRLLHDRRAAGGRRDDDVQGPLEGQRRVQRRAAAVEAVHGRDRQAGPALAHEGIERRRPEGAVRGQDVRACPGDFHEISWPNVESIRKEQPAGRSLSYGQGLRRGGRPRLGHLRSRMHGPSGSSRTLPIPTGIGCADAPAIWTMHAR